MFYLLLERRPGHKLRIFCYMVVSEDGDPTQLAKTLGLPFCSKNHLFF